jgi:hypothetical protein
MRVSGNKGFPMVRVKLTLSQECIIKDILNKVMPNHVME